jgi:polyisoprenoid-binding protein YceI
MSTNIHTLGPQNAALQVKTYRERVAQKVGHDLVIDVTRWEAQINLNAESSSIMLEVDSTSLEVREGVNGVKPLSDKDRADIRKSIDDKVLQKQRISFRSTSMAPKADGYAVQGELSIGSQSRPVSFDLSTAGGRISGIVPLVQREFGIKPYSALMGALKVRDEVEIVVEAPLPS